MLGTCHSRGGRNLPQSGPKASIPSPHLPCLPFQLTQPLPPAEYCARGSLTDVLRGGKNSAAKAKQLDWARRLNMVCLG